MIVKTLDFYFDKKSVFVGLKKLKKAGTLSFFLFCFY